MTIKGRCSDNTALACRLDHNALTGPGASLLFRPVIDHQALLITVCFQEKKLSEESL